jgi:adenylate cyclase
LFFIKNCIFMFLLFANDEGTKKIALMAEYASCTILQVMGAKQTALIAADYSHHCLEKRKMMEIEKKYLVKKMPEMLETYEWDEIEQGYLCKSPVVRIRHRIRHEKENRNQAWILTYKSREGRNGVADGDVRINREEELPLSPEAFAHLKEKVDGYLIQKIRYRIPLKDGHCVELDSFRGCLEGLCFAEVEFQDEEDAANFMEPEWLGENVSADEHYSNSFLSTCASIQDILR